MRWPGSTTGAIAHADRARVVIQYGTSRPPVHAEGHDLLPVAELEALMAEAVAVVCHGGPGTIMGAREAGVVPICIPRQSGLGEHVDDHQVRFATRVAQAGQVHLASTADELATLLDRALGGDAGFRLDLAGDDPAAAAVARFGALVDRLLGRPAPAASLADARRGRRSDRSGERRTDGGMMTGRNGVPWPSVSVVIVTQARDAFLRRAIRSVVSQRYPGRLECIVVFDQCPAFDLSDVAPADGGDRTLRVIENRGTPGPAGARNAGADRAFGDVLSFCRAGDEWLPGKVAHQIAALEATGADRGRHGDRAPRTRPRARARAGERPRLAHGVAPLPRNRDASLDDRGASRGLPHDDRPVRRGDPGELRG